VRLEPSVLLEAHEEQRCVRNEEQRRADRSCNCRGRRIADKAENRKAVHRTVNEQIQEHRVEQSLGQMLLELRENEGNRYRKEHAEQYYHPHGNCREHDFPAVARDKEGVAYHKGYAARREPFGSLGHKQNIAEPTEDKCEYDFPISPTRREHIEA